MLSVLRSATQEFVGDARQTQLAWLRSVLETTGYSPNKLADKTPGVNASTLYRFLDDDSDSSLRALTINRISQATGIAPPEGMGLGEGDARPYEIDEKSFAPSHFVNDPAFVTLMIETDALRHAGFERGDVLVIDTKRSPQAGQLVCAQVYDLRHGSAETVIRYYHPPYLIAVASDPESRIPLMIDNETVQVRGVVVRQLRSREVA